MDECNKNQIINHYTESTNFMKIYLYIYIYYFDIYLFERFQINGRERIKNFNVLSIIKMF